MSLHLVFRALAVIFFNLILLSNLSATHIVGGEMNYRCLGNNQYEIRLTVYRDCYNGVPYFDQPASIGFFSSSNQYLFQLRLNVTNDDTLSPRLYDPCVTIPPNICYHKTTYVGTVSLPFRAGGYQIVYQRCCRNMTINNLVNPAGTGATYYTYITEQGLLTCNSNPVFRNWPEPLICNNIPIDFDHSATDLNNDSLVYDLVTPLNGASTSNPMPQPPNAPPFANVTWAPGYSLTNVLRGSVPLTINARTGRLTGMPGAVGQYVVGIRVREFRNGALMSVTQRDFQYNVGVCGIINNAAFFAPEMRCQENSLQVTFSNQSIAQFPVFRWDFGVPGIVSDTSNLRNPVYNYTRRGTYNVRLIVGRGGCIDTAYQTLLVDYKSLDARFSFVKQTCTQQAAIQFNNQTTDSLYAVTSYNWDLGNGQTTASANPLATYTRSGTYTVRLRAVNAIGCIDTFSRTFTLSLPQFNAFDTVRICPSGTGTSSVTINPNAPISSTHRYSWTPATGLNNPNIANPIASPTATTTYRVRISAYNAPDTCVLEKNVTVYVSPKLIVYAPSDTLVCSSSVWLQITVNYSAVSPTIVWRRLVNGSLVQVGTGATYNYMSTQATETFRVLVTDRYGCSMSKDIIVRYQPAQIRPNIAWTQVGNCTDTLTLSLRENALPSGSYTYQWNFGSLGTSSQATPSIRVANQGNYPIALTVTNAGGCYGTDRDTVRFVRPQSVSMPSQYSVCQGDSVFVGNAATSGLTYSWSPATYLSHPFASSTFIKPVQSMAYVLTIRSSGANYNCSTTQSVNVTVPQSWTMNAQNDTLVCSNQFTVTASANTTQTINYQWFNITSGRLINIGNQQTLNATLSGNARIMLIGTDLVGCLRRDTFLVTVAPNQLTPVASVTQVGTCSSSINLQFQATATGFRGAALSGYNWSINGNTFNTPTVQSTFTGPQTIAALVTVTDVNGCVGSTLLNVPIKPFLPIVNAPLNIPVCSGSIQTIGLASDPGLTYQWSSNVPSNQQTNSQVTFAPTTSGAYQLTATWSQNGLTCSDTKGYNISIAPPIQKRMSADTSVCGGSVALAATALTPVQSILWFATQGASTSLASGATYSPSVSRNSIYYTQFTDNTGCTVWDSVKVTFNPNILTPQILVSQVGSCSDSLRVRYSAVNMGQFSALPATYNWRFSNGMTQTSQAPEFVVRSSQSLTANITLTANNGCYGVATNAVQVQIPELTLPSTEASICKGDTVRLAIPAVAGQTYLWLPISQVNNPNASSGLLSPSATTNFTVVASTQVNGFICRKRANFLVNVTGDIPLTTMPDTTVCGGFTELRATTDATSSITWLVRRDNRLQVVGQGNVRPFYITQDTTFFAMATNSQGCKTIDSVKLDFNEKLVYADFTYVQSNCSDNITLMFNDQSTSPSGTPVSWNWRFGDGQRSTSQNPQINFRQSGQLPIRLQVSLNNDCISLAYDTLNFKFPSIDIPTSPISRCWYVNGVNLSNVNTTTANDQSLTYQWSPSTGLNNPNIANPIASPTEATTYQVTVTGETLNATCSIVRSIEVKVPTPFSVNVPEQSKTCGNFFDYTAPEGSKPELSYNWFAGNPASNQVISNNRNLNVALAGRDTMFYFVGRDNHGCYHKDSMRISIDSNSIPVRFNYNFGACSNTVQVNFAEQVLDTFPNPIARYSWTFGNGSTSIARRPSISYNQSGEFPIRLQVVKQNGCKGEKLDTIRYNAPILPQYKNNINRCHRDTISLLGTATPSPNIQYQWTPSIGLTNPRVLNPLAAPAANIVYTISVTGNINQQSCYNSGKVTVTVPPQIQANLQPKFSSCSDTAQISVNSNAPNLRYQWFDNNRRNLNLASQTIRLFAPLENQSFSVVITDANNCSITEKTEVVNKKINILVPPTINVCKADSFHIQAKTTTAQQDVKWSWSPFQNIAQFNQNSVSGLVTQTTQFTVAATNDVGCRDSKTIQIQVINDFPSANATVSKRVIYEGEDVQLNTTPNPQYTYEWKSESPLSNVRIPNPTSRPMQPQTLYQLSVRNQYGCLTQDTITVIRKSFMCKDPYIFVPNAFTPNGDNENDVLYARSAVTEKTYFAVFNRWGEMVFETHDKAIGWDGTFKGQILEPDVFAYYLKVECIGGQVFEKRGNVSLLK